MTRPEIDFYFTPSACSQAAHILLHEAGVPHRRHQVDIFTHRLAAGGDYLAINPNGYVPALVMADKSLLTENVALLDWIAQQGTGLLPAEDWARTRHLQMLAFLSTEVQKPFVGVFFSESEDEKAWLREALVRRFGWISGQFHGDFVFGKHFTASDAFLYVMLRWAVTVQLAVPESLRALAERVEQRDSVAKVLVLEAAQPLFSRGS